MAMLNNRFTDATGEVVAQPPHRLAHLGQQGLWIGQLCLQVVEPLVKTRMEVVTQSLPLGTCTNLG
jgi:hypothetical protein